MNDTRDTPADFSAQSSANSFKGLFGKIPVIILCVNSKVQQANEVAQMMSVWMKSKEPSLLTLQFLT